jgi:hypothetical protein
MPAVVERFECQRITVGPHPSVELRYTIHDAADGVAGLAALADQSPTP